MTYKTVSYKTIFSKVNRDFGISLMNMKSDAIEWIGEALQDIGHNADTEMLSCPMKVTNHRAPFPCNLDAILAIEYNGQKLPRSGSHRTSHQVTDPYKRDMNEFSWMGTVVDSNNMASSQTFYANLIALPNSINHSYMLNPDYIITSFDEGDIVIHYRGYVLDEEGYPKIPDSKEHSEAIAFYILYKWLSRGNTHSVWRLADVYQMWIKLLGQASNKGGFPDIGDQERFTNMWVRVARDNYEPDRFYRGTELRQNILGL